MFISSGLTCVRKQFFAQHKQNPEANILLNQFLSFLKNGLFVAPDLGHSVTLVFLLNKNDWDSMTSTLGTRKASSAGPAANLLARGGVPVFKSTPSTGIAIIRLRCHFYVETTSIPFVVCWPSRDVVAIPCAPFLRCIRQSSKPQLKNRACRPSRQV